jgi:hypothetical protein
MYTVTCVLLISRRNLPISVLGDAQLCIGIIDIPPSEVLVR